MKHWEPWELNMRKATNKRMLQPLALHAPVDSFQTSCYRSRGEKTKGKPDPETRKGQRRVKVNTERGRM